MRFDEAERTAEQKVVIYDKATGQRHAHWPVDVREIFAKHPGKFTVDPNECDAPAQKRAVEDANDPKVPAGDASTGIEDPPKTPPGTHPIGGALKIAKTGESGGLATPARSSRTRNRNTP